MFYPTRQRSIHTRQCFIHTRQCSIHSCQHIIHTVNAFFEKAMEVAPDEVMLGLQEELTEDMRRLLSESQGIYHDVKYFSEKAYKEKPVQMRKLGLHK